MDQRQCPVCLGVWHGSGPHRITALKCGHLFGRSCIARWVTLKQTCPECQAPAKRTDLVPLVTARLAVVDVSGRDSALAMLEGEKQKRRRLETENKVLMHTVEALRQAVKTAAKPEGERGMSQVAAINIEGGRVTSIVPAGDIVLSSCARANAYGLHRLSLHNTEHAETFYMHSKEVRDVCPRLDDVSVLTCSMDKMVKVSSLRTNTSVAEYDIGSPVWSCAWGSNGYDMFCGTASGEIVALDIRNTADAVRRIPLHEGHKGPPIHSLHAIAGAKGGLVIGTPREACVLYSEDAWETISRFEMSLEGKGTCGAVQYAADQQMVSCSMRGQHAKHVLFLCQQDSSPVSHRTLLGFQNGAVMSRPSFGTRPNTDEEASILLSGDETNNAIIIWDVSTGAPILQSPFKHPSPILDLHFERSGNRAVSVSKSALHVTNISFDKINL